MPQNPSDIKAARDAAGKYGRINWGEYSKMTGTPIPKNAVPATVKPSQGELKARANAKRLGRINVSEYIRPSRFRFSPRTFSSPCDGFTVAGARLGIGVPVILEYSPQINAAIFACGIRALSDGFCGII